VYNIILQYTKLYGEVKMNLYNSMTKTNTIIQYKMSEPCVANIVGYISEYIISHASVTLQVLGFFPSFWNILTFSRRQYKL